MKKLILGLALAFFLACSVPRMAEASPPDPVAAEIQVSTPFVDQVALINKMNEAFPLVDIQIYHVKCGQENAFYWSRDLARQQHWPHARIVLCEEMDQYPDAALMFAAHEMGHAITDFYTDTLDEQDADELAALAMIAFGESDALYIGAFYYLQDRFLGHWAGDEHPGSGFRHWFMSCMAQGAEGVGPKECGELYRSTDLKWYTRLSAEIAEW